MQSIWIGVTDTPRYHSVFPGARGLLFWLTLMLSALAGLNAMFIALRQRWAVWINPVIGVSSIVLLAVAGSPRSNQVVVAVACTVSTLLAWYLWWRTRDRARGHA
jgi:hypothetical protein